MLISDVIIVYIIRVTVTIIQFYNLMTCVENADFSGVQM